MDQEDRSSSSEGQFHQDWETGMDQVNDQDSYVSEAKSAKSKTPTSHSFQFASTSSGIRSARNEFAPPSAADDAILGQDTPDWKAVPATWLVFTQDDKLCAHVKYRDESGKCRMKPTENVYLCFDNSDYQYFHKTVTFSKRLSSKMSTTQLANRVYNTSYSLHNGLKDHHMEVIQGESRESKSILLSVPTPCSPVTSILPNILEDVDSLSHGKYKSSANFEKPSSNANWLRMVLLTASPNS